VPTCQNFGRLVLDAVPYGTLRFLIEWNKTLVVIAFEVARMNKYGEFSYFHRDKRRIGSGEGVRRGGFFLSGRIVW